MIVKILLIEDDEYKSKQIKEFIVSKNLENINNEVIIKKSFQSGMCEIVTNEYDFILLDMSIPTFEASFGRSAGRSRPYGGREILFEMKRKNIKVKTIVVTQFNVFGEGIDELNKEQLDESLKKEFGDMYLGLVYYNVSAIDWKKKLLKLMEIDKGEKQ